MVAGWFRGRMTISELLDMPVGYIQTLYSMAIEESEASKKESEEGKTSSKAMEALEDEIM